MAIICALQQAHRTVTQYVGGGMFRGKKPSLPAFPEAAFTDKDGQESVHPQELVTLRESLQRALSEDKAPAPFSREALKLSGYTVVLNGELQPAPYFYGEPRVYLENATIIARNSDAQRSEIQGVVGSRVVGVQRVEKSADVTVDGSKLVPVEGGYPVAVLPLRLREVSGGVNVMGANDARIGSLIEYVKDANGMDNTLFKMGPGADEIHIEELQQRDVYPAANGAVIDTGAGRDRVTVNVSGGGYEVKTGTGADYVRLLGRYEKGPQRPIKVDLGEDQDPDVLDLSRYNAMPLAVAEAMKRQEKPKEVLPTVLVRNFRAKDMLVVSHGDDQILNKFSNDPDRVAATARLQDPAMIRRILDANHVALEGVDVSQLRVTVESKIGNDWKNDPVLVQLGISLKPGAQSR